ncbi:Death ligand signal enhancer [Larimichthys crocea]|uniref:Uncharacterized protein n=1 Tax=Larimichthys crocea TaxID=215358 RepID=A0ACD3RE20_LARCR|nr:Death ligand signal enhancer [Larimichthys crocea]
MAAESGDETAMLFLGQCFESGFGVQQNLRTAIEFYKRAAKSGNKQARSLLTPPNDMLKAEDAMLRSIRSAPCFSVADHCLSSLVTGYPSLHQSPCHPSPPASLLEYWEFVCVPGAVLHSSSPPSLHY